MNISCEITPFESGFNYRYVIPIQTESGAKVMPIFGSDFNSPNLFTQLSPDEFLFTGKFYYSPNNLKAFGFYSDKPPGEGSIILRAEGADQPLISTVPVPESGWLMLIPLIWAALSRRRPARRLTT